MSSVTEESMTSAQIYKKGGRSEGVHTCENRGR